MVIDKSFKIGVVTSLVASILFVAFLQPIFNWIWKLLSNTSNVLYSSWRDNIIERTSQGNYSIIPAFIFLLLIQFFFMYMTYHTMEIIRYRRRKNKNNLMQVEKPHTEQEIVIPEQNSNPSFFIKWMEKTFNYMIFFLFVSYILCISIFFKEVTINKMNSTFNQRINAVAPYTTDQQHKILVSKWALMKDKQDYIAIMDTIKDVAKKNKIVLPEPLIEMKK